MSVRRAPRRDLPRLILLFVSAAFVIAAPLMGCAEHQWETAPSGSLDFERMSKVRLLKLYDGRTTRDDVLRIMGPPDRATDDGRIILYRWITQVYINDPTADPSAYETRQHFLAMRFDGRDVLIRHELWRDRRANLESALDDAERLLPP
jgi:hypothetical protein